MTTNSSLTPEQAKELALGREPSLTPEQAKALATAQLKSRVIKGTATGAGIAVGAATADVAIASAATAAEATFAVVEGIALVPTIVTVAAIGGACYGTYRLVKWLAD